MKKILYIGDFKKLNGPSKVDVSLVENLNGEITTFQSTSRDLLKLIKLLLESKIIHVSGISFIGFLAICLSKLFFKKSSYTMHGSLKFESKSKYVAKYRLFYEKAILLFVNRIFIVSKLMYCFIDNYSDKAVIIPNGYHPKTHKKFQKEPNLIVAIGGGRIEKGVLELAQCVKEINNNYDFNCRLVVFGEDGPTTDLIKTIDCVDYRGFRQYEEVQNELLNANIFASFSVFESFSLAIVEAIESGCKVLTSANVGVLDYVELTSTIEVVYTNEDIKNSMIRLLTLNKTSVISHKVPLWNEVASLYLKEWEAV
jgi:glycosyltransferase involved in cell wall biosynthesis